MKPTSSFITGLLAGAAIGGVIALLYAPKSGKETREQVKRKFEALEEELDILKTKASNKANDTRDNLASKLAELQREIDKLTREI